MKIKIYLYILLGSALTSSANGESFNLEESCSYFGEELPSSIVGFDSDNEAIEVISKIVKASGLPQNFQIRASGVPNAAAAVRNGERFIFYNQAFIRNMKIRTGSNWAAVSIMAHEIGHHLAGHTLDGLGSRPNKELEADTYSGFILNKLGADLSDAQVAMALFGSPSASRTHPARHDRLAAIAHGWMNACEANPVCSGSNPSEDKREPQEMPAERSKSFENFPMNAHAWGREEITISRVINSGSKTTIFLNYKSSVPGTIYEAGLYPPGHIDSYYITDLEQKIIYPLRSMDGLPEITNRKELPYGTVQNFRLEFDRIPMKKFHLIEGHQDGDPLPGRWNFFDIDLNQ